MSLRKAINEKCFDCAHDPLDKGYRREQVQACQATECPLYEYRPVSRHPLKESLMEHWGLTEQPLGGQKG